MGSTPGMVRDYNYIVDVLTRNLIRNLWNDDNLRRFAQKFLRKTIRRGTRPIVGIGLGELEEGGKILHVLSTVDPEHLLMQDILSTEGLEDVRFTVTNTGPILAASKAKLGKKAQGGDLIQRGDGTTGTFGCLVDDRLGSSILTCHHVLASMDSPNTKREIMWSGRRIGITHTFAPIVLGPEGQNEVDAALCRPDDPKTVTPGLRRLGRISGSLRNPAFGLKVKKEGASSGVTRGVIRLKNLAAAVVFEGGHEAVFVNQLGIIGSTSDRFATNGDSGSIIINENNVAVGLLSAVSEGIDLTFASLIETVFAKLIVKLA